MPPNLHDRFGNLRKHEQTYRSFQPNAFTDLAAFYNAAKPTLSLLLHKEMTEYWLLSDAGGQCWFSHVPVVIIIDGIQHELTAFEQNGFSLTVNQIDLTSKHDWYALGRLIPLEWKKNYYHDVNQLLNTKIRQVSLLGFSFNFNAEAGTFTPEQVNQLSENGYHPYGIEFELETEAGNTSCLCVFNALGKNSLIAHRLVRNRQLVRIPFTDSPIG